MRKGWWQIRDIDDGADGTELNKQVYDEHGKPILIRVPTRLDEHGDGVEWVYCTPATQHLWDARRWS